VTGGNTNPYTIADLRLRVSADGRIRISLPTSAETYLTAVGFEPTPFRTSALSWRLRPLGHAVDGIPERSDG
jgi:hypothetical protein